MYDVNLGGCTAEWDPISKQPTFKSGAVKIVKVPTANQPSNSKIIATAKEKHTEAVCAAGNKDAATSTATPDDLTGRKRHLELWLGETYETISLLHEILDNLLPKLVSDSDAHFGIRSLHMICGRIRRRLEPQVEKFGEDKEAGRKHAAHFLYEAIFWAIHGDAGGQHGPLGVLFVLRGLQVYMAHIEACLTALNPVSQAIWDQGFFDAVQFSAQELGRMQS